VRSIAHALLGIIRRGWPRSEPAKPTKKEWYRRRAAEMRWYPTPSENELALWLPPSFERQVRLGRYIVDFFEPRTGVVVEVDGASHKGKAKEDLQRQEDLEHLGFIVLRFTNDQVALYPELVLERVLQTLEDRS
jgi:very-short-patch-repair endonuclease